MDRFGALSVSLEVDNTPGSSNAFLERLLGLHVMRRRSNTIVYLLREHAKALQLAADSVDGVRGLHGNALQGRGAAVDVRRLHVEGR
jgi:hypothetical protein